MSFCAGLLKLARVCSDALVAHRSVWGANAIRKQPQRASSDDPTAAGGGQGKSQPKLSIPAPKQTSAWALAEAEFSEGLVGGKSRNLATLRSKLPDSIAVCSKPHYKCFVFVSESTTRAALRSRLTDSIAVQRTGQAFQRSFVARVPWGENPYPHILQMRVLICILWP